MSARKIIVVASEFLPVLLESLLEALRDAAETVEGCGLDPESYPEPLEQFDRIRVALDAIGWGVRGDITLDVHRHALQSALTDQLRIEQNMAADGTESAAHGYAVQIEAFMREAGLEI
jgi:hypothetical protein